jgi:hypothetical protein
MTEHPPLESVEQNGAETRDQLTGREGGRWRVITTRGSNYVFDLNAGTVERIPGPTATATINDTRRPLRTIDRCQVGATGAWTMQAFDFMIDFYWQACSVIVRIERLPDDPDKPEGRGRSPREPRGATRD